MDVFHQYLFKVNNTRKEVNMKTKNKISILTLSLFLLTGLATTLSFHSVNQNEVKNVIDINAIENITLSNKKVIQADGKTSITCDFSINPNGSTGYTFTGYTSWSTTSSEEYESETWREDKNPNSYISFTIDDSNCKLMINCLQPFGNTVIFTLVCNENTKVTASLSIDYVRKVTDKGSCSFTSSLISDNQTLPIKEIKPTYTIGSKGKINDDVIKTELVQFKKGATLSYTYDNLIDEINLNGFSDTQNVLYDSDGDGVTEKMTITQARTYMVNRSNEYLTNFLNNGASQVFSKDDFIEMLTFYKAPNTYMSPIEKNDIAISFINKYKKLYSDGGGFEVRLSYNDVVQTTQTFNFNINAVDIQSISFPDTSIEF